MGRRQRDYRETLQAATGDGTLTFEAKCSVPGTSRCCVLSERRQHRHRRLYRRERRLHRREHR